LLSAELACNSSRAGRSASCCPRTMNVYGIDFTSAPGPRKPITIAECSLQADRLRLRQLLRLMTRDSFADFLCCDGPWIAGIDFPFGQPRKLIENLGWPAPWHAYVARVKELSKEEFERILTDYSQGRARGDKQHLRATDVCANSRSPMMLYGVPVGKMFYRGAPALLRSAASIVPMRPTSDNRIIVEAYPALIVRKLRAEKSYKSDDRRKQTAAKEAARQSIVEELRGKLIRCYGLCLEFTEEHARSFVDDPTADCLDAFLCAIQAAWAFTQKSRNYGIPSNCDLLEGWIADPSLLSFPLVHN